MKKVMIAEDDLHLSKIYEMKIKSAGFDVILAKDGEEVFALLQNTKPDILLLDLLMPKKDGHQVLKEMKENPELKNIPILVTSNLSKSNEKQQIIDMGALDYIVKSNNSLDEVVNQIQKHLGSDPSSGNSTNPSP